MRQGVSVEIGSSVRCEPPLWGCSHGKGHRQAPILAPHGPALPRQSPSLAAGFGGGSPGWIRRTLTRVLSPDQLALFDELRQIRNSAVHLDDFKIDENKAKEYLILAELLISKLEKHSR